MWWSSSGRIQKRTNGKLFLARTEFGDQAEDLDIEPDERDEQAEGSIPFHVFRRTHFGAFFDEIEIEDEVERSDDDDKDAEGDAEIGALVDEGNGFAEKAHHE